MTPHAANYPVLAAMDKDYLTVLASSVPTERAFFYSGKKLGYCQKVPNERGTIEMVQLLQSLKLIRGCG